MRTSILIALATVVVLATLATMNNACKSGQHAWCAPVTEAWHHNKNAHG
jgi:hypothetical protein